MSKEHGPHQKCSKDVEAWELEMVSAVVRAFRTQEPEELQAVLIEKLLVLKQKANPGIRDWRAYLAKFLYNKSANWVRDTRARERRQQPLPPSAETGNRLSQLHRRGDENETVVALAAARRELSPELRLFWDVLVQENGNQTRAAQILGLHRNTARLWLRKISEVLHRHGF